VVRTVVLIAALVAAACAGEITASEDARDAGGYVDGAWSPGVDGDVGAPQLTLTTPTTGSTFVRDALDDRGALVAAVPVTVVTEGPIVRVEVFADDVLVGAERSLVAELALDGPAELRAVGYDADDQVVAGASVTVTVEAPTATDCYDWLDLYQLDYTRGPTRRGVANPVTVTTPLNGIGYR